MPCPAVLPATLPAVLPATRHARHPTPPRAPRRAFARRVLGACLLACATAWAMPPAFASASDSAGSEAGATPWFTQGRPSDAALQAVDALAGAAADGLDASDYDAEGLRRAVREARDGVPLAADAAGALDASLTRAMQRYLSDLHDGRVDPRQVHANFPHAAGDTFDPAASLREALAHQRLPEALHAAAPAFPLYPALRRALAHYRALAGDPAFAAPLPALPGGKLAPGQAYAGSAALARRLEALGDLPAGTRVPARYEGALVNGVKAFQARHGLDADGVLGGGTLAQLNTPMATRVRQIELTMERLRWTPLLDAPRMIVVNVPEFVLRAYEVHDGQVQVKVQMKVIVGKALDTRTPLFKEDMRYIEFSPYWNVPRSIARAETIPRIRRDPAYFQRQGFEFVGGDGRAVTTLSDANLDAVLNGQMRIRQRPGPQNALGDIKFVFPNNDNIYLHHTPTVQLFQRGRRDLSHGCIRVEEPVALARFVLQDMAGWDEARIRQAMTKGQSNTLRLQQPLPVVLAYGTAIVQEDGRVMFLPDIYGLDRLLDQALRQHSTRRMAAGKLAPRQRSLAVRN